jgi:hypothetical protein
MPPPIFLSTLLFGHEVRGRMSRVAARDELRERLGRVPAGGAAADRHATIYHRVAPGPNATFSVGVRSFSVWQFLVGANRLLRRERDSAA